MKNAKLITNTEDLEHLKSLTETENFTDVLTEIDQTFKNSDDVEDTDSELKGTILV